MNSISEKKRTLIFLNIMITCIATTMMSTALIAALPMIVEDLSISVATGQWLSSSYYLCMAIMTPVTAFLVTRFSNRGLYLTSVAGFMAGLAICLFSGNFVMLLLGRILQACFNGILTAMTQVILMSVYPMERRGTIMGWYGLSQSAAPVIAPTIAGILIDSFGWRSVFACPLLIMAVAIVMAFFCFENVLDASRIKLDRVSFLMSVMSFGGIALAVGNISTGGFTDLSVLLPLLIGGVTAVFFVRRQTKSERPFLEFHVLKNRYFTISVLGSMITFFISMSSTTLMPVYYQSILGCTATVSGLLTLPGSLANAVMTPIAGKLYDRIGIRKLFVTGSILLTLSNLSVCLITLETSVFAAALLYILRSAATGLIYMPFVTWGCSCIKKEKMAHGTALLNTLRNIAGSIGMSVSVGIMTFVAGRVTGISRQAAELRGLNTSFFVLGLLSIGLFFLAVLGIGKENNIKA